MHPLYVLLLSCARAGCNDDCEILSERGQMKSPSHFVNTTTSPLKFGSTGHLLPPFKLPGIVPI